jgi:integrase/recombinase XerD
MADNTVNIQPVAGGTENASTPEIITFLGCAPEGSAEVPTGAGQYPGPAGDNQGHRPDGTAGLLTNHPPGEDYNKSPDIRQGATQEASGERTLPLEELLTKLSPSDRRLIRELAYKLAHRPTPNPQDDQPDLRGHVDQWALAMITQGKMPSTVKLYRGHIMMLLRQNPRPRQKDVEQLLQSRVFTVGPSALTNTVNALKSFFDYLIDNSIIDIDPTRKIKAPSKPLRERVIPKARQVAQLLSAPAITNKDRALIITFAACGLRASELLSCRRSAVDLERRQITVVGKGNKQRTVRMTQQAATALERHLHSSPPSSWLFPGRDPAKHFDYFSLSERFHTLCDRAGITPAISPHQLRHYFASVLLHAGMSLKIVSQLLGHASPSITANIYWHLLDEKERIEAYDQHDPLQGINEEMARLVTAQLSFDFENGGGHDHLQGIQR